MKWNKAVKAIEQALAAGKAASVHYHRKWMKNDVHYDKVDSVCEYEWENRTCKGISTYHNFLDEGTWIIDEVLVEGE